MRWNDAEWRPWRPEEAAERLQDVNVPWYVAAGWAVDLFVGYERREHEDLEIAVPVAGFAAVAARLDPLDWYTVGDGEVVPIADAPDRAANTHQTWGLDRAAFEWRIDVFREPAAADGWVCRRSPQIRLRYDELIEHSADGVPYARPEVVLLFKAKAARPKDEEDLRDVLPLLSADRRALLRGWIALAHPGHRWLEVI